MPRCPARNSCSSPRKTSSHACTWAESTCALAALQHSRIEPRWPAQVCVPLQASAVSGRTPPWTSEFLRIRHLPDKSERQPGSRSTHPGCSPEMSGPAEHHIPAALEAIRCSISQTAIPMKNTWFVSFDKPSSGRNGGYRRVTQSFQSETEAKRFASELALRGVRLTAGTINPVQPKRLIASEQDLAAWLARS